MTTAMMWPWLATAEPHPHLAGYRPVLGENGMVSSPHAGASTVGANILRQGGNAIDAAIATSAALMVLLPMQCGLGGDAYFLIASSEGIKALDASGRSAKAANSADLLSRGHRLVPPRSGYSVTVPGAVSGWIKAHSQFGTMDLAALLQPAIEIAETGYILSRHGAASFRVAESELRAHNALALWSSDGKIPELYHRIKQPRTAEALRRIAHSNGRDFYCGGIAKAIAEAISEAGGWLTREDLADHEAEWIEPISTSFRGHEVFTTPASTQGFALLGALKRLEVVSPSPLSNDSASDIHLMVEAVGASLHDRDAFSDDRRRIIPEFRMLWSAERASRFSDTFDPTTRTAHSRLPGTRTTKGDTAHLAVVDRDGMAVSLIQSLFFDFGSAIPVHPYGFTLQNRGAAFHLEEGTHGALAGGIRPPSTLMPSMVVRDKKPAIVFGCMGGDGQVQTQLQLLVNLLDGKLDVQQAISKPRWYLDRSGEEECHLLLENGFGAEVVQDLSIQGHKLRILGRWEEIMGHAQAISITSDKVLIGGADPRSDGQVAAV